MELIGKGYKDDGKGGNARKGIVWVARRIPDGYVSAHANQARITTFPKDDPENCLYSPDVVAFAREMGYYDGTDEDFSFCEAYAPADFGALRGCEARVWAFFRTVADGMDKYVDYAMGHNAENRMPLWVKPRTKVSPKVVFDCMRDHYEGTPMDMTTDIGAGGSACPTAGGRCISRSTAWNTATNVRRPRSRPASGSWHRHAPTCPTTWASSGSAWTMRPRRA